MYRSIPVANKACHERNQKRHQEMHKQRIKAMRPQVDTSTPSVAHLDHLRNNLKREQLLEERYHEIDRANRILLHKMSDIMKSQQGEIRGKSGPPSLNRDARKTELTRITQENNAILKRIQRAQPVYNHVQWEDSYRKSATYLKNTSEYPVVLNRKASRPGSLTPLGGTGVQKGMANTHTGAMGEAGRGGRDDLRYVLKEGKYINEKYFLVEMTTDGRTLAISAYDGDAGKTLELLLNEKNHRRFYRDCNGDYNKLAEKLRIEGEQLTIDMSGGPLDSGTAAMAQTH